MKLYSIIKTGGVAKLQVASTIGRPEAGVIIRFTHFSIRDVHQTTGHWVHAYATQHNASVLHYTAAAFCSVINIGRYFFNLLYMSMYVPSVLWRCWLGGRKGIRPVKTEWWGTGLVICLERGADLHMAQLMPLPLSLAPVKSRLVLPFWYRLTQVVLEKRPLNGCSVWL